MSDFVKPFTLLRTKTHKNGGFRKRSSKWILTKMEVFENAVDQCEHTKTDKNKNATTPTTKYLKFLAKFNLEFGENKNL